ncbi:hypothetical protein COCNU_03G002750 [Cocos nucifera]|uniref:Uncharacterized protein n=1 Tax=Cocos nucifera TaxID=13894 RepID=A0A8K0I261_COCNU|nr:hypothetical protein COCNU_03G002750 [Cocos nucifera]
MAFYSISPPAPSHTFLATKCHPFLKTPIPAASQPLNTRARRFLSTAAAVPELGALEKDGKPPPSSPREEPGVTESVKVLKAAAKTRGVPAAEVLDALAAIKKAKAESSSFLETLGGTESPGRTWMLIFTAQGKLEKGRYFPVTAVQRFDAA